MAVDLPDWTRVAAGLPVSVSGQIVNPGDTIVLNLAGASTVAIAFTSGGLPGTMVIVAEVTYAGAIWVSVPLLAFFQAAPALPPWWLRAITGSALAGTSIVPAAWQVSVAGAQKLRLRATGSGIASANFALLGLANTMFWAPPTPDTFKSPAPASVANGSSLTVWTPASGRRFGLQLLQVSADATGELQLTDGGTTIMSINQVARTPVVVPFPGNGYPSALPNNVLALLNNTGGTTGLHAYAAGWESG